MQLCQKYWDTFVGRRVCPSQRNGVRCSLKRFGMIWSLSNRQGSILLKKSPAWQTCSTRRNSRQIHVFTRPIHVFPTQHTSFPVHYPTVTKLMNLWWDMLAGYVREWVQELEATGHRVLDRIRIKMKWEIRKLSWKRRLRRKWQAGPSCVFQDRTMLTEMHNFVFKCTDFCRVHGNLLQNQVHKNFCPMKMQVYIPRTHKLLNLLSFETLNL